MGAHLQYVAGLTAASQPALVTEANAHLAPVAIPGGDRVLACRARRPVRGADRTVVVVRSDRLREGQMRGILRHVAWAECWLAQPADTLRRGTPRRDPAHLQQDIAPPVPGRQHVAHVLHSAVTISLTSS
jgi:hypothetical protein